ARRRRARSRAVPPRPVRLGGIASGLREPLSLDLRPCYDFGHSVAAEAIPVTLPTRSRYVVVGAGIHGLSTAYHLAKELRARGLGSGADVVVLDKRAPGSGASGIACGVVRNNYFQPAMSELMQACVEVWESDPAAYLYN